MQITLLGTGSADGWPNPFCRCRSCTTEREAHRSRRPSAALIDAAVLVDCGPTTPHGAGADLREVEHLLVTHGHPDHLNPAVLLTRSWVDDAPPLHVWGPAVAIEQCRAWLGPDSPVRLHVVAAGDDISLPTARGGFHARVLPAAHHHGDGDVLAQEALLFVVTAPDGHRLLYATDTGPLPATTRSAVGGRVDALLVDETFGDTTDHGRGHLDLATLPVVLGALRAAGVVDDATVVVATHLSHHNPPEPELRARLAVLGVDLRADLDVVDTAYPRGRRPQRTFLLGGARSGKSAAAEQLAGRFATVAYVATGGERPDDPEWAERVARHRDHRPPTWTTHETTDVVGVLDTALPGTCVLVDCLTLWLTAVLDDLDAWARAESGDRDGVQDEVDRRVDAVIDALLACRAEVVLVSNEVGMGVVPPTPAGRLFADLLGRTNAHVASACDDVTLMVAGRPIALAPADRRSR